MLDQRPHASVLKSITAVSKFVPVSIIFDHPHLLATVGGSIGVILRRYDQYSDKLFSFAG